MNHFRYGDTVKLGDRKWYLNTVKLGNKERFDKEKIGTKEPFPVTNLPFKELLALRNNFRATKKFLITKFDCTIDYFPFWY